MADIELLRRVVAPNDGWYCIFSLLNGKSARQDHFKTLEEIQQEAESLVAEGRDVYFSLGKFITKENREAENCGWMHTSGYADVADLYQEQVQPKDGGYVYSYDKQEKKVGEKMISIQYLENGKILSKSFKTYFTHHGPVMAKRNGQWISVRSNNRSLNAIVQSWKRTKAKGFEEYKQIMELRSNTSNNTVFADSKGNIAYWHGNFMPKRNPNFDYTKPVDGTIKATDWQDIHPLNEIVQSINPSNGWLQNCNATPFTVAGDQSPKATNYPAYMAPDGENGRGLNAVALLSKIDKIVI
jgi:acyl-homoserine lactone acylase PvdQ